MSGDRNSIPDRKGQSHELPLSRCRDRARKGGWFPRLSLLQVPTWSGDTAGLVNDGGQLLLCCATLVERREGAVTRGPRGTVCWM